MTATSKSNQNYKRYIGYAIYFVVFSLLFFLFAPKQKEFYLEDDIQAFVDPYYVNFAIILGLILVLAYGFYDFRKRISVFGLLKNGFGRILMFTVLFTLFQPILTGFVLYLNRQIVQENMAQTYRVVDFNKGMLLESEDLSQTIFLRFGDFNRVSQIAEPHLFKTGDVVHFPFKKGWLGMKFIGN